MNRKNWFRFIALFGCCAVLGYSQAVGTGASPGAESALRFFAKVLLGAFGWGSLIALIWHCYEWALDHSRGLAQIAKWAVCSGIGFGAYYIVSQLQAASIAQF
jgi:hypothetical protein